MRRALLPALAWCFAAPVLAAQTRIGDAVYRKQATREETERSVMEQRWPDSVTFGEFFLLTPFPYAGHESGDLARALPPEAELARMAFGGPGPDLQRTFPGKLGVTARWQSVGRIANRRVELRRNEDPELNLDAVCYLYGTVESKAEQSYALHLGSDDGVRLWLNGSLIHENDVPRGLDPDADALAFDLHQGLNHVLVKVAQGAGDWAFQFNTEPPLDPTSDALLRYFLDRDFPPHPEAVYYPAMTVPVPEEIVLEVGGLDVLEDGRAVVSTRRGEVYFVENLLEEPPVNPRFRRFAAGLHEPLGLAVRVEQGEPVVYAVQRGELTRLVDEDGDGSADLYETVCDDWGVSGNYHEFAFGPEFDSAGNAWVTLNVGFCGALGKSVVPWRGWAVRISPDGRLHPFASGLRSPNGIGIWGDDQVFYLDNQGDWVATNRLSHLTEGSWQGHPSSLRWREDFVAGAPPPPRTDAAVWFPYQKMGQSAADFAVDRSAGRFGPFTDQIFVGDQTLASVMRVFLEEVDGVYQGACFPFRRGLDCGVNRLAFAPDGSLLLGQTDRGWGSVGRRRYGLERIVFAGEVPFEVLAMRATADGFELEFTRDHDPATALDPASYRLESYTYLHHAEYGCPETDPRAGAILAVTPAGPRRVRLRVDALRPGYVHELEAAGVRSAGEPLLHPQAYYTLQRIPAF